MDAYVLSNIRHDTVDAMSILSEKTHKQLEDITLSFAEAEKIRDCLCDANNMMTEILKGVDIKFTKAKKRAPRNVNINSDLPF